MTMMYTSHLGVYRTSIVRELGGLRAGFEGSQDYDFTLRFVEKTTAEKIAHIPKVLYHWRQREGSTAVTPEAKPYVFEASRKACEEAIQRRGIEGKVDEELKLYQAHVTYYNSSNPLWSASSFHLKITLMFIRDVWIRSIKSQNIQIMK